MNVYDMKSMRQLTEDIDKMERDLIEARESLSRRDNGDIEQYRCTQCEFRNTDYDVVVEHIKNCHASIEDKSIKLYIADVYV